MYELVKLTLQMQATRLLKKPLGALSSAELLLCQRHQEVGCRWRALFHLERPLAFLPCPTQTLNHSLPLPNLKLRLPLSKAAHTRMLAGDQVVGLCLGKEDVMEDGLGGG